VDGLLNRLSREQRVGQLVMVGAAAGVEPSAVGGQLREQHVGGVVLLGTWVGAANVQTAAEKWQQAAQDGSGGVGVLVAADQEGGQVQHLRGDGFTSTPSALTQGPSPETVAATAATVGAELKAAGVNVALAPVADTVAASFAGRNAPIGALRREYGNDPATVASAVVSAVRGLQGAQVSATLKHFPGLGRVTGNTDLTAAGTTDATTTSDDAYLEPFRAGIQAGADLVMVSSALYPKIDAENRAVFSRAVITGVLRNRLSYGGVVISDDVGAAKAVAAVPVGERATRFVGAGGDVVLTGLPSTVPVMAAALTERAAGDAAFAAQVDAAARRVLDLKIRRGLAHC
jgi:beta-N-acetylhexosaminidase